MVCVWFSIYLSINFHWLWFHNYPDCTKVIKKLSSSLTNNIALASSYLKSHQPPLLSGRVLLLDFLKSHISDFSPSLFLLLGLPFPGETNLKLSIWMYPKGRVRVIFFFSIYRPPWTIASSCKKNIYMWWLLNLYVQMVNPVFYYTSLVACLIDISNLACPLCITTCISSQESLLSNSMAEPITWEHPLFFSLVFSSSNLIMCFQE